MYQSINIIGRLGGDPEMRYTPSGMGYTRFSVATSRKWTDNDGNRQEETTWWRVVVWGKQAETCNQYLAKGRLVMVEGSRVHASAYINKDNQPAASLELTGDRVVFLDRAGAGEQEE